MHIFLQTPKKIVQRPKTVGESGNADGCTRNFYLQSAQHQVKASQDSE
jgi:hypothetical protein